MKERLHHLLVVEDAQTQATPEYQRWSDTRLDRWLVDWALRTGRERTAKKITTEKGIYVRQPSQLPAHPLTPPWQTLVDVDMFMDIREIELGLVNHSCTEALKWCNENKPALRKLKVHSLWRLLLGDAAHSFTEHVRIRPPAPGVH